MTQEELQLANDKLTARLNKAVEVFREKESTIKTLTDDLATTKEELNGKIKYLEILQTEYNNVIAELNELKSKPTEPQIPEGYQLVAKVDFNNLVAASGELDETRRTIDSLNGEVTVLKQNNTNLHNKINQLSEEVNSKNSIINDQDETIDELKTQIDNTNRDCEIKINDIKSAAQTSVDEVNELLNRYKAECNAMELEIVSLKSENEKIKDNTNFIDHIRKNMESSKQILNDTVTEIFANLLLSINNIDAPVSTVKVETSEEAPKGVTLKPLAENPNVVSKENEIDPITGELKYGAGTEPWKSTHGVYPTDSIFQV